MPHLAVNISGEYTERPLKRPLTAGSAESNALVLSGKGVMRHHLKIMRDNAGWFVEDITKSDSVLVNGIPARKRYLINGDEICIGDDSIVFHNDEPDPLLILIDGDDARIADLTELPRTGAYMERKYIQARFTLQKARKKRTWLNMFLFSVILALVAYALNTRVSSVPPRLEISRGMRLTKTARKAAQQQSLEQALSFAQSAIRAGIPIHESRTLLRQMRGWATRLHKQLESRASKLTPQKLRTSQYRSTKAAAKLIDEDITRRYSAPFEADRLLFVDWNEVTGKCAELSGKARYFKAELLMRDFARRHPDSEFVKAALFKANVYRNNGDWRVARHYRLARIPSQSRFDFSRAQAVLGWRSETGEWERRKGGLTLVEGGDPTAVILHEQHEYCGYTLWFRFCCEKPSNGSISAGIQGSDESHILVSIFRTHGLVTVRLGEKTEEFRFSLTDGKRVYVEAGVFGGKITVFCDGISTFKPREIKLRDIFGYPAILATIKGTKAWSFDIGW